MLYREAGQFKTTYAADMAVFPLREDRIGLAFVIALGEYVASVLVFVPQNRPISIAIAAAMRDFDLGTAAAYGVTLIFFIALSMTVAARLENKG